MYGMYDVCMYVWTVEYSLMGKCAHRQVVGLAAEWSTCENNGRGIYTFNVS